MTTDPPMRDLIICQRCGNKHGPCEAKYVVRFQCGHCRKECDTDNYQVPVSWSQVMQGDVIRFSLCPGCTTELNEFLAPVALPDEPKDEQSSVSY